MRNSLFAMATSIAFIAPLATFAEAAPPVEASAFLRHHEFQRLSPDQQSEYLEQLQKLTIELARIQGVEQDIARGLGLPMKWNFAALALEPAFATAEDLACNQVTFSSGLQGKGGTDTCVQFGVGRNSTGQSSPSCRSEDSVTYNKWVATCPSKYRDFYNTLPESRQKLVVSPQNQPSPAAPPNSKANDLKPPGERGQASNSFSSKSNAFIKDKDLRCLYAGVPIDGKKDDPCKAPESLKLKDKDGNEKEYKCPEKNSSADKKVVCNPLLFGTKSDGGPICVRKGSKATSSCAAGADEDSIKRAVELAKRNPAELNKLNDALRQLCPDGFGNATPTWYAKEVLHLSEKSLTDLRSTCEKYRPSVQAMREKYERSNTEGNR